MVSSSVYGIEPLLNQIHGILSGYGYEVWMSHAGTMPVDPRISNFDNCLLAAERCSLFLGIITGRYGSGQPNGRPSITQQEMDRAISIDKPRWFLVHHDVVVARQLLQQYRFTTRHQPPRPRTSFRFKRTPVLEDIRVLDMYELAMRHDVANLDDRRGNWVQQYIQDEDVFRYLDAQFSNVETIQGILSPPEGGLP
jgi:hypothetical protein